MLELRRKQELTQHTSAPHCPARDQGLPMMTLYVPCSDCPYTGTHRIVMMKANGQVHFLLGDPPALSHRGMVPYLLPGMRLELSPKVRVCERGV